MCSVLTCLVLFQLKSNPSNKEEREAQNQLQKSDEIQRLLAQAHDSYGSRDCRTTVALLDTVIEVKHTLSRCCRRCSPPSSRASAVFCFSQTCIWDVASREMRAECLTEMGEMGKAIGDLKATSKLKNDNTQAFYKLSTIYYALGDHEMSLRWDTSLIADGAGVSAFFRYWSLLLPCLQWGARVPEAGSRPQAVLQPLQASQKAQQADSVRRGTDPGAEVGVCHFIFICLTSTHYIWPIRWRITVPLAQAYCACEIPTQVELAEMNEEENFSYDMYDFWL